MARSYRNELYCSELVRCLTVVAGIRSRSSFAPAACTTVCRVALLVVKSHTTLIQLTSYCAGGTVPTANCSLNDRPMIMRRISCVPAPTCAPNTKGKLDLEQTGSAPYIAGHPAQSDLSGSAQEKSAPARSGASRGVDASH